MTFAEYMNPNGWFQKDAGPRYLQLRHRIERAVADGILQPNGSLPPERELAEITDLSRVTIRKAIHELVETGTLVQRQGSGTFVRKNVPKLEQSLSRLSSFTEDMASRGKGTTSIWLERGIVLPTEEERAALDLPPEASAARLCRLRQADGVPLAIEKATLPLGILPNPLVVTTSLYDVLEAEGRRPVRAAQRISAINLKEAEADLLGVPSGAAGLSIQRLSYLPDDTIVEFTRSTYRGDAYDFVADLTL